MRFWLNSAVWIYQATKWTQISKKEGVTITTEEVVNSVTRRIDPIIWCHLNRNNSRSRSTKQLVNSSTNRSLIRMTTLTTMHLRRNQTPTQSNRLPTRKKSQSEDSDRVKLRAICVKSISLSLSLCSLRKPCAKNVSQSILRSKSYSKKKAVLCLYSKASKTPACLASTRWHSTLINLRNQWLAGR